MSTHPTVKFPSRQKGLALVILIIAIALASLSYIVSELSAPEIKLQQEEKTIAALKKAKQSLINYAVTYGDIDGNGDVLPDFPGEYGFLPCPDYNGGLNEGLEDNGNCGAMNVSKLGYLPWRTLGIPPLYDDSGSCLLYAVSGMYKNDEAAIPKKTEMLNEDSNGTFQVVNNVGTIIQGANPEDRVVAIVLAPGKIISGQNRVVDPDSICGKSYGVGPLYELPDYLEGNGVTDNGVLSGLLDTIDQFILATSTSAEEATPYNDRFITITREEIWSATTQRSDFAEKMENLTEALAMCLASYNSVGLKNQLPWPAPVDFLGSDYRADTHYNDETGIYAGRVPFIVNDSNTMAAETLANLFDAAGCKNLTLTNGPVVGVDLSDTNDEYRQLWKNWKDHFFYALSSNFEPAAATANDCLGTCIEVDDAALPLPPPLPQYAGIVFFSGSRLPGITRNAPPPAIGADDKLDVSNYLENGNDVVFKKPADGNNTDTYKSNVPPGNDIMFCISSTVPLTVVPCPV